MKHLYQIRLINRDFSLDDAKLVFKASRYQAKQVFTSLAFVLPCSPYEKVILALRDGTIVDSARVR